MAVHQLLNTLYVTTERAYVHVDHETLKVEEQGQLKAQVPLHHLGAVVCFGDVLVSPALVQRCAAEGRELVFLDRNGRFQARVVGPTTGNVLLRQAQYQAFQHPGKSLNIARAIVAGKVQNARQVLLRGARETAEQGPQERLRQAAERHAQILEKLPSSGSVDEVRGWEGEAAQLYFHVFQELVREDRDTFKFDGRNRRPPLDPVNAVLSFLYTLLRADCVSALEGVGLDPQLGFLHALRPGRPALGLDLMEELRTFVADRLSLTLINRKQ
ncbi:MAG: type I-C CRISPR-associated endonuclease Cas1, partial [SAR202 cluster bacterium]|nr:type I-C CRISPR-associated endonuclease Cas1 [SAR202 cluster bacterium]